MASIRGTAGYGLAWPIDMVSRARSSSEASSATPRALWGEVSKVLVALDERDGEILWLGPGPGREDLAKETLTIAK